MRSTAIYAHVQRDPAKRAADRVSRRIAEALGGRQFLLPKKLPATLSWIRRGSAP
jgi:hypothetical protein